MKLMQFLKLGIGSSTLMLLLLVSCKYTTVTEDYTFANNLQDTVTLIVYNTDNMRFLKEAETKFLIAPNDIVLLRRFIYDDGTGGVAGLANRADSVYLKVGNSSDYAIIWRKDGNHSIMSGYEGVHDWYDSSYWEENTNWNVDNYGLFCYILTK